MINKAKDIYCSNTFVFRTTKALKAHIRLKFYLE